MSRGMETLLLVSSAYAADTDPSFGLWGSGLIVGWLLIAALLGLLLLSRVHQRERCSAPPLPRPAPKSRDELGRLVFEAVISEDVRAYRALFLTGNEARQVLQADGEDYLAKRSLLALAACRKRLSRHFPLGCSYEGSFQVGQNSLALRIRSRDGRPSSIIVGTIAVLGEVHRLVHPAFLGSVATPSATEERTEGNGTHERSQAMGQPKR